MQIRMGNFLCSERLKNFPRYRKDAEGFLLVVCFVFFSY